MTWPVGFTVIVKVLVGPVQEVPSLAKVGVTTIVAITGKVPVLTVVKELMSPVPVAARPILVVLFVQAYVVVPPVCVVPKVTLTVFASLQITWLSGWFTWAVGFTVIVKVLVGPVHEVPP